ncbi:MAG: hypothetical protein WBB36_07415 [Chitinophagales bacterium]
MSGCSRRFLNNSATFKRLIGLLFLLYSQNAPAQFSPETANNYWSANHALHDKAAKNIIKSKVAFGEVDQFLKDGRTYSQDVNKGFFGWDRRTKEGIQLFALILVPRDYTPEKKWPVRVVLHGDISHMDAYNVFRFIDTTLQSYKEVEEIRIYPSGYFAARWYYKIQYENIMYLLDSVKQLYNVNENLISMSGFSDGGTGTYAFVNYNVTPFNCFLPYIGSCGSLKVLGKRQVYFNNYRNKPMFIVNGKLDQTFPPPIVVPYVEAIQRLNNVVSFFMIDTCDHTLRWLPQYKDTIDRFILEHTRNPNPSHLVWQTDNANMFNRNHWALITGIGKSESNSVSLIDYNEIIADGKYLQAFRRDSLSGIIDVTASGNTINVLTKNITSYTLLLSPDQFDFSQPFKITTNNVISFEGMIEKDVATLLKWNSIDNDRTMLYAAEKEIVVGKVFKLK